MVGRTTRFAALLCAVTVTALLAQVIRAEDRSRTSRGRSAELMLFSRLKPGDALRLEGPDLGRIEGRLVGSRGDSLVLIAESGRSSVRLGDVDGLWVRRTAGKSWSRKGALAGAVTAGVLSTVQEILLTKRWYNDPPDSYSLGWHLAHATMWAIVLVPAGAAAGYVTGSTREIWEPLLDPSGARQGLLVDHPPDSSRAAPEHAAAGSRRVGEMTLHGGAAWTSTRCVRGRAPYVRWNLYATPRPRVSFGPELGWVPPGLERRPGDEPDAGTGTASVVLAGLRGRLMPAHGRVRPLLHASCGLYTWGAAYVGGSAGLGLRCDYRPRLPVAELECTWHEPLQELDQPCITPRFFTASLGVQLASW